MTLDLLVQLSIVPELVPAIPPVPWEPVMAPDALLLAISPLFSLEPTIPPTLVVPLMEPEKAHPVMLPELLPAIPPTFSPLPEGEILPSTVRSLTRAPR